MISAARTQDSLDRFFSSLQTTLGPDFPLFLDDCSLSAKDLGHNITANSLNRISNRLNITLDSIFSGSVDFETLKSQFQGRESLPTRYQGNEHSSRFSSIYMIDFCRRTFGPEATRLLLQRFQLKESQFSDPLEKNNILLPRDLCEYVYTYFGGGMVEAMGESSIDLMKKTKLGMTIQDTVSGRDFFDFYFNEILPATVENNYSWTIDQHGPGYVVVKGLPNPEVVEALGAGAVTSESLETLRLGFLKSIPKLYRNVETRAIRLKSISAGDSYDQLRLDFDQKNLVGLH